MTILCCCLYLLLMVALGYFLFSIIHSGPVTLTHWLGLVPALGAGTLGWLLFWLALAGCAPSRSVLGIIGGGTLAGIFVLAKLRRLAPINRPLLPRLVTVRETAVWLLAALVVLLAVAGNLSGPLADWDALAIWGFKAKILAHEALRPTPDYFHDLTLSYSHLDYPLMLPFLTAGAYAAMGTVDDQAGKLVSIFLDALVVPLVFMGLRWKLSRLPASCLCAVLVLLPAFLNRCGNGCADLPLTMFYAGSIIFVARWIERQAWEDLILAVLFSSFMAFTKSEGLVLALINGLVLVLFAARRPTVRAGKGAVVFFIGWLTIDAAWLIWKRNLPQTHEDYGSKLLSAQLLENLPKLQHVIWEMFLPATTPRLWGWVWVLAGLMAMLGRRAFSWPHVQAVWILLGLQLFAYALVYSVTPWNLDLLLATTLDRLLWHAIPAVVLLAGWHWAEIEMAHNHALPPASANA